MKNKTCSVIAVLALLCGIIGLVHSFLAPPVETAASSGHESAYDRIMRTRTIRCGYFVWPPFTNKDPATGALSGFNSDFMEAMGKALNVKIEWSQELNFSTFLQDLAAGRYDMECAGGWPNASRGQLAYFSKPIAYMPSVVIVRADDTRFDEDQSLVNSDSVTMATIDGETSSIVHDSRFAKTKQISLPSNTPYSDLILNVTTRKADFTILDLISARQYIEHNPGQIKLLPYDHPVNLIALGPTLPQDERLKHMIDIAIDQLQTSGQIETLLRKYEDKGQLFLRVGNPDRP